MTEDTIFLETNSKLPLIDIIEMLPGTEVIFKAHGRVGVPHKILRVAGTFSCEQNALSKTKSYLHLKSGDIVAAYKVPQSATDSRAYHLACLGAAQLKDVDNILQRRFNTSLKAEQLSNRSVSLNDLDRIEIPQNTYAVIALKSIEKYKSNGQNGYGLTSIIQLKSNMKFLATNTSKISSRNDFIYQAHEGDFFAVLFQKENGKDKIYLCPISKNDVPFIKAQDKKQQILYRYEANNVKKLIRNCVLSPKIRSNIESRLRQSNQRL